MIDIDVSLHHGELLWGLDRSGVNRATPHNREVPFDNEPSS
jgi:hypothetical protein